LTEAQFSEIFRRVADEHEVGYEADVPKDLISFIRGTMKLELRQCYPRDVINQVLWAARYEGKKPYLDHASLAQAVEAYFLAKA
jgi:hypothetical protein